MPKNKTHSGAKKRFRVTGTGKVMREQANGRHLLEHKSSRRTRRIAGDVVVSPADTPRIKKLLGRWPPPARAAPTGATSPGLRKEHHVARVKRAVNAQKKRRATLERASGYRGQRSRLYRKAKEQVTHSLVYAYRDRKVRKGDFRKLWIQRINAAAREQGLTYNRLIQGLKLAGVEVDRRVLADLAVNDAPAFNALVQVAKDALPADVNAPRAAA